MPSRDAGERFPWYEFFAGGGMARIGLGSRWECVFANEWLPEKATAYRACFGPAPELRVCDVAALSAADLPGRASLVWASFPCQDLSLAGNG
ncbi:MAG: DNA cytosine methyltransferase, partial [Bryobacteraceae bacterium]